MANQRRVIEAEQRERQRQEQAAAREALIQAEKERTMMKEALGIAEDQNTPRTVDFIYADNSVAPSRPTTEAPARPRAPIREQITVKHEAADIIVNPRLLASAQMLGVGPRPQSSASAPATSTSTSLWDDVPEVMKRIVKKYTGEIPPNHHLTTKRVRVRVHKAKNT